jgi:hypothetical protein
MGMAFGVTDWHAGSLAQVAASCPTACLRRLMPSPRLGRVQCVVHTSALTAAFSASRVSKIALRLCGSTPAVGSSSSSTSGSCSSAQATFSLRSQHLAGRHFERDVDHRGAFAVRLLQALGPEQVCPGSHGRPSMLIRCIVCGCAGGVARRATGVHAHGIF